MTKIVDIRTVSGGHYFAVPEILNPFLHTGYVMPRTIRVYTTERLTGAPIILVTDKIESWREYEKYIPSPEDMY